MQKKGQLIKRLQDVQNSDGYVSQSSIKSISKELGVSESHIYGVATFYAQFRLRPLGKHTVKICRGTACHVAGSLDLVQAIKDILKLKEDEDTTSDRNFTIEEVACLGCCSLAPALMVDKKVYGKVTKEKLEQILDEYK
ncbi:MAG: NADH-quinone oxidoreductase subunit NuoE [bacterium]